MKNSANTTAYQAELDEQPVTNARMLQEEDVVWIAYDLTIDSDDPTPHGRAADAIAAIAEGPSFWLWGDIRFDVVERDGGGLEAAY